MPYLEGALRGEESAIASLYLLVVEDFTRYARGCGCDADEAGDVAGDAWVALFEDLRAGTARIGEPSWTHIRYVRAAAFARQKNREYRIDPELVAGAAVMPVDDWEEARAEAERRDAEMAASEGQADLTRRAIENLRPYPRQYLTLRYLDGRPVREIAARTGEPPARVSRRIRTLKSGLVSRMNGRPYARAARSSAGPSAGALRGMPSPGTIRALMEEFLHEYPDGSAGECVDHIVERTGLPLDRPIFYTEFWVPRKQLLAHAEAQACDDDVPPRAPDDFRLRDGSLRPAGRLSAGMRAQIRAFVLVLREDDPRITAREAMRKAGERHGVAFIDIQGFRNFYFATHPTRRTGKGSGGFRVLKGRTPAEIEVFVSELLQRRPEATGEAILAETNRALGTAIRGVTHFRARYVAPARRRLGIPRPPRSTPWVPPVPPEGWRAPGALPAEVRDAVVAWLREEFLADGDAAGLELFRRAREHFRVDWRGASRFSRAYLQRARDDRPRPWRVATRLPQGVTPEDVAAFLRARLAVDPALGPTPAMRLASVALGAEFSSLQTFRRHYFDPVRGKIRASAHPQTSIQLRQEYGMTTSAPSVPGAAAIPARYNVRTSTYTPHDKPRAIAWLVEYITANPRCTIDVARYAVQDALNLVIAKGTFHTGFFSKALAQLPEIRVLRGPGTSGAPGRGRAEKQANPTARQRARVLQLVACLKRDRPGLISDPSAIVELARGLDGVPFNNVAAFRRNYIDPVVPALPGTPYPDAAGTAALTPPRTHPTQSRVQAPRVPKVSREAGASVRPVVEPEQPAPATPPVAEASRVAPFPENVVALLASDPIRAIRLEGVAASPGQGRIILDIAPLPMADAARLYSVLYAAVADELRDVRSAAPSAALPENVVALLAIDPIHAIRLEGVADSPGHGRIILDIGPLGMADAARLYSVLYAAVADALRDAPSRSAPG